MDYLFNQELFNCRLMAALEKGKKPDSFFKYYLFNYILNHRLGITDEEVGHTYSDTWSPSYWWTKPKQRKKKEIKGITEFFKEFNVEMNGFGKLKLYKERRAFCGDEIEYDYNLKMKHSEHILIISTSPKKDSVEVYTGITDIHSVYRNDGSHYYIQLRCYGTTKEIVDWFKMIDEKAGSELKPEFDALVLKLHGNKNIKEVAKSTFKALFEENRNGRDCTLAIAEGKVEKDSDKMSCSIRLGQWIDLQLYLPYTTDDWKTIVRSVFAMYDVYAKQKK